MKLVYYPPIMENQMEKKMENQMETGGIQGLDFKFAAWGFPETLSQRVKGQAKTFGNTHPQKTGAIASCEASITGGFGVYGLGCRV